MALQDKIVLKVSKFDKIDYTEINISATKNKLLFTIGEYEDASITNLSSDYDIYIENIDEGGSIKISNGESQCINSCDHPYPPMIYQIKIVNKNTKSVRVCSYRISHSYTTTESQYQNMILAIKEYDEYLLYDPEVKYLNSKRIYNASYRNFYSLIESIIKNESIIIKNLISIYNNPILIDKKVVVKSNTLGKQSMRSIRKNMSSYKEGIIYSSKLIQVADCQLNKYLLYMLTFSKRVIVELVNKCNKEIIKVKNRLNLIINKTSSYDRGAHATYQIENHNKKLECLNYFLNSSRKIMDRINDVINCSYFVNVEQSPIRDNSIVYYPSYLSIERNLFLTLFNNFSFSFSSDYDSILASPLKQTSKLFEAYCLLVLDTAINDLGFESIDDEIDYDHIVRKFVKDDYEIELMYEIDAKDVSVVEKGEVYYLFNNAKHITPDFYLIFTHKGIPIKFIVFDAKCRKAKYVNKDIVEGKYENTIREYLSLRYSGDDDPFNNPKIVDSLWLLLPSDENNEEYQPIHKLNYQLTRLNIDGNENEFIDKLEEYLMKEGFL